jgi:hypothetical protein
MEEYDGKMNAEARALPSGFEALEPYVASWAIDNSARRAARREASNTEELRSFYDAVQPRMSDALIYLDGKPLAEHDAADRRLMTMLLSLAHVSLAVEIQTSSEARAAPDRGHVRITRSTADR